MSKVNADVFAFVFTSVIDPDATVTTAVPPVDGEAVKVAVYVVPLPEKPVRVPSVADTSAEVNVVVDSLTVKVNVVVEPEVVEGGLALINTVGRAVSYVIDVVLLAELLLPAASVNREVTTERVPVPEFVLAVGVNTAEYTVDDVVVRVPILPPATVMSSAAKLDEASDNVKVTVSAWPTVSNPEPARVKVTVGAVVSTSITTAVLEVWVSVIPSNVVVAVERTL
jgi:hypothetical protein